MPDPLIVLGPNLSREEAAELRGLLKAKAAGRDVVLGNIAFHTPGQELKGEVIAIGDRAPTAEEDARGSFKRYETMDQFRAALEGGLPPTAPGMPPQPLVEPPPLPPDASMRSEVELMDRIKMIQYGAAKYPGQRQWALMGTEKLRAALLELEGGVKVERRDVEAGD